MTVGCRRAAVLLRAEVPYGQSSYFLWGRVMRGLCLTVILSAVLATGTLCHAQEIPAGMIKSVPDRPTRVFVMAAFDEDCRQLPAPKIDIVQPPKKGAVQFREGQQTTVQFSLSGKCTGTRITGTGIYYAARADASGEDEFSISARGANGEIATRTFRMFITEGL